MPYSDKDSPASKKSARAAQVKWKNKRYEKGLCTRCGRPLLCKTIICADCKRLTRECAKIRVMKRLKEGLCGLCGQPLAGFSRRLCLKHWFGEISLSNTGTTKNGPALQDLMQKQGYKCAYTNKPIELGVNAQLDHKTPVALGGTNELSNLHWVDAEINRMKGKRTHNEFIELCRLISIMEGQTYL